MRLIAKVIRISRAKFHCNRLTTVLWKQAAIRRTLAEIVSCRATLTLGVNPSDHVDDVLGGEHLLEVTLYERDVVEQARAALIPRVEFLQRDDASFQAGQTVDDVACRSLAANL